MKFIVNSGGLGNQIFRYCLLLTLRNNGFKVSFLKNRFRTLSVKDEIENVFEDIKMSDCKTIFIINIFYTVLRFFPKKLRIFLLRIFHVYEIRENGWFKYDKKVFNFEHYNQIFIGTWQSEKYFISVKNDIQGVFQFNEEKLSDLTIEISKKIKNEESVSIHIRRGDYLHDSYKDEFANVCTIDYYLKSINYIKSKVSDPVFYVFSDDINWVKIQFKNENMIFVDFNMKINSWQDMYLMSLCKHNIIANSTFSWWGAYLNANVEKIVVAPQKWIHSLEKDDIIPSDWIRI